ncbi:MAG TPA: RdgB/HAM1 family non-canonical purine NTP pyrophosphatase [Methanoregula sp.]|nr:RdgB/HAM1 family non-canonical purine NTP pyrophosphatase [Methanoregula sp.]
MKLTIVTSNAHKVKEISEFFGGTVEVSHVALDIPEYRSDDVKRIAEGKARFAFDALRIPVVVDDTAFSVNALNGFPGPYAAYALHTIGYEGILRLMEGEAERCARFTTAIAYADKSCVKVFSGTIEGTIARGPRGCEGFGYDPIFQYGETTLAELPLAEKSRVSHRAKALSLFRDWFRARNG